MNSSYLIFNLEFNFNKLFLLPEKNIPWTRRGKWRPWRGQTLSSGTLRSRLFPLGCPPVDHSNKKKLYCHGSDRNRNRQNPGVSKPHVVGVELTMSSQTVEESLDVRSEDGVECRVVDFVQMFSQSVPEVEGDLHHLCNRQRKEHLSRDLRHQLYNHQHSVTWCLCWPKYKIYSDGGLKQAWAN